MVAGVFLLFLLIFGILGMHLYGGRISFCDVELFEPFACGPYDGCFGVADLAACDALNGTWMAPHYGHFDNIGASVLCPAESNPSPSRSLRLHGRASLPGPPRSPAPSAFSHWWPRLGVPQVLLLFEMATLERWPDVLFWTG